MDSSETYIKMCDCPEIQTNHEWEDGDYYHQRAYKDSSCSFPNGYCAITDLVCTRCDGEFGAPDYKRLIWLPRQDQLQEMAQAGIDYCSTSWGLLSAFYNRTQRGEQYYSQNFISMEQLWLAFVMKDKYNKVWTGSEWITEKK